VLWSVIRYNYRIGVQCAWLHDLFRYF
jgi:hypothetical protein